MLNQNHLLSAHHAQKEKYFPTSSLCESVLGRELQKLLCIVGMPRFSFSVSKVKLMILVTAFENPNSDNVRFGTLIAGLTNLEMHVARSP